MGTHHIYSVNIFSISRNGLTVDCVLVDSLACFWCVFLPNKTFFKKNYFFSGVEVCDSENKISCSGSGFLWNIIWDALRIYYTESLLYPLIISLGLNSFFTNVWLSFRHIDTLGLLTFMTLVFFVSGQS